MVPLSPVGFGIEKIAKSAALFQPFLDIPDPPMGSQAKRLHVQFTIQEAFRSETG